MRAFSLIEMMLVVAILAILAAIAVPAMGPYVDAAKLEGSAEAVASLVGRAQAEAMATKRCTRVRVEDDHTVIAERLNSYDCDVDPTTKIIPASPQWIEFDRILLDEDVIEAEFDPVPPETSAGALGGAEMDQFRFRPSGRLFSSDLVVTNDDGVLKLSHTNMASGMADTKKILVEAQGLICVLDRGVDPSGTAPNFTCP
jgi:prepilin-type N-terminal cleavage/methylation domain-containing protein